MAAASRARGIDTVKKCTPQASTSTPSPASANFPQRARVAQAVARLRCQPSPFGA